MLSKKWLIIGISLAIIVCVVTLLFFWYTKSNNKTTVLLTDEKRSLNGSEKTGLQTGDSPKSIEQHPSKDGGVEKFQDIPKKIGNFVRDDEMSVIESNCVLLKLDAEKICLEDTSLMYFPENDKNFLVNVLLRRIPSDDREAYVEWANDWHKRVASPYEFAQVIPRGNVPTSPLARYNFDDLIINAFVYTISPEGNRVSSRAELYPTNPVLQYFKQNLLGE